MMKMQIAIDEQKAIANGINPQEVYDLIDNVFASVKATKRVLDDGTLEYTNNQAEPKKALSDLGIAFYKLRHSQLFGGCCDKWLWLENIDDDNQTFDIEDILIEEKKRNVLFVEKAGNQFQKWQETLKGLYEKMLFDDYKPTEKEVYYINQITEELQKIKKATENKLNCKNNFNPSNEGNNDNQ